MAYRTKLCCVYGDLERIFGFADVSVCSTEMGFAQVAGYTLCGSSGSITSGEWLDVSFVTVNLTNFNEIDDLRKQQTLEVCWVI